MVMELHEFSAEIDVRERNNKLAPGLLKHLKELQNQAEDERLKEQEELFKRPFALYSKSPVKRRMSQGLEESLSESEPIKSDDSLR